MANNKKEEGVDWVKVAEGAAAVAGAVGTLISVLGGKGNSPKIRKQSQWQSQLQ